MKIQFLILFYNRNDFKNIHPIPLVKVHEQW